MKYIFLIILFLQILLPNPIVIQNQIYTIEDIYKEYGKQEWESTSSAQKEELINDFINRRLATLEAQAIGFENRPDIAIKLYNRSQLALVNITYEELVAKPLISKALLIEFSDSKSKTNIGKLFSLQRVTAVKSIILSSLSITCL